MNRTTLWFFLMMAAWLQGCDKNTESPELIRPALVMKVTTQQAIDENMALVGEVKSRYESSIGFRIDGKIVKRHVEVGDQVEKGQQLVSMDPSDVNLSAKAAAADVAAAEASLVLAKAELDRQTQLFTQKFISKAALDMTEAAYKTSLARLKQTKSQYAVSNNQSQYTHLLADRAGVVSSINAEPGQVVSAGQKIANIVDYGHVEVLVAVPESRMHNVSVGKQAVVKLWADKNKTYTGKVREVSPAASSETRAFDVRISIDNADDDFKLGMTAGVNFGVATSEKIIIPTSALTELNGVKTVWIISDQAIANKRTVQAGQFTERGVEITSGLKVDEVIAVAGVHTLVEGQQVKPQNVHDERSY